MMLIENDKKLLHKDSAYVYFADPTNTDNITGYIMLMFQYPPKVTGDSRKATWKEETNIPGTTEPIVLFASSGPREISIAFSYIYNKEPVTGGGGVWDAVKIQEQLRLCRGYFQRVTALARQRNLAIWAKFWGIGGQNWMTFRMLNLDIKYSETLIREKDDLNGKNAFPFRTDVTMTLATWTQNLAEGAPPDRANQRLPFLESRLTPEWY